MSRKKCHRKVWSTNINPVAHAIAGAAVSDDSALNKLRLCELSAIDAMTKGLATVTEWHDLTEMLNLCETMGRHGIGPEALAICEVAQSAAPDEIPAKIPSSLAARRAYFTASSADASRTS